MSSGLGEIGGEYPLVSGSPEETGKESPPVSGSPKETGRESLPVSRGHGEIGSRIFSLFFEITICPLCNNGIDLESFCR